MKEENLSADQVLARVRERSAFVKTLRGDGSITMEGRQSSQSGSFDVDLLKPDSVLVDLHGPFGIHVGTFSLTRDKFVFYNRMDNSATFGKPDGKTLESMLHVSMGFDELIDAFTGDFPVTNAESPDSFSMQDGQYLLQFHEGRTRKEYRIDAGSFIINSYRMLDDEGKVTMVATATKPKSVGEIEMPRLLRVVFPAERRSITIAYDNIELNGKVDCSFVLPDNVDKTYH